MSNRDPRIDPRPGDLLRHPDGEPRAVLRVDQINRRGHTRVTFLYADEPDRICVLGRWMWRRWTRGDAVLVVAP